MLAPLRYDTLDHFIAWLETKDPTEEFYFLDSQNCAVGQYDRAHQQPTVSLLNPRFDGRGYDIVCGDKRSLMIAFGDVLKRAKAIRGW